MYVNVNNQTDKLRGKGSKNPIIKSKI